METEGIGIKTLAPDMPSDLLDLLNKMLEIDPK